MKYIQIKNCSCFSEKLPEQSFDRMCVGNRLCIESNHLHAHCVANKDSTLIVKRLRNDSKIILAKNFLAANH